MQEILFSETGQLTKRVEATHDLGGRQPSYAPQRELLDLAGARKTGTRKTGTRKTGTRKTGARKTGARKTGARKTGESRPFGSLSTRLVMALTASSRAASISR